MATHIVSNMAYSIRRAKNLSSTDDTWNQAIHLMEQILPLLVRSKHSVSSVAPKPFGVPHSEVKMAFE
eukprot:8134410-Prorocentrum_lima.AAC.1